MKQGMNLSQLASIVMDTSERKRDYVVDVKSIDFGYNDGEFQYFAGVQGHGGIGGSMNEHALRQMTTELDIPATFVNTLKSEDPTYLPEVMNRRAFSKDSQRMLRTVGPRMVAAVSPSFSRDYDNDTILKAVLPILRESDLQVESCNLSETMMHLKAFSPRLSGEVDLGDVVQSGIHIRNSDVGLSRALINEINKRLACMNGMTRSETVNAYKRIHRGSRLPAGFIPSIATTTAHQLALASEMRDVVTYLLSEERFNETVNMMKQAKEYKFTAKNLEAGIRELGRQVGFTQTEGDEILAHLIAGNDLSQYGMLNAVTRYSQDVESYDRATELEGIGGKVLELKPRQLAAITYAQEAA